MRRYSVSLVFLILFSAAPMFGADGDLTLQEAAEQLAVSVYYHSGLKQVLLVNQTRTLHLNPGKSLALLNGRIPVEIPGIRPGEGNSYLVSSEAFESLKSYLAPETGEGRRIGAIFIDAGHGGRDPGTIGRHSIDGQTQTIQEKDIVLNVALSVGHALRQAFPEKNIVLSREGDVYLTLEERTSKANAIELGPNEDILYISIHANAAINSLAKGFEVWYLPPEYRRQLISPGDVEVISDSVIPILNDILEEEITTESILLAQAISSNIERAVGERSVNRGLREEEWYVVRNAFMPSVLAEIGFVTNREEFELLSDPQYLQLISTGIYNGVLSYVANFESLR